MVRLIVGHIAVLYFNLDHKNTIALRIAHT